MKKNNMISNKIWMLVVLLASIFTFSSCGENEREDQPVITGIRVLSADTLTYKYKETYTAFDAGNTIAILGKNMGHVRRVLLNGTSLSVKTSLNTKQSVVVEVPALTNIKTAVYDNNIEKDQLIVETTHGTATFDISIKAEKPVLRSILGKYQTKSDTIILTGQNLVDVRGVYFSSIPAYYLEQYGGTINDPDMMTAVEFWTENPKNVDPFTTCTLKAVVPNFAPSQGTTIVETGAGFAFISHEW